MPTRDPSPADESLADLRRGADAVLDVTGLDCPLPVLKARARLRDLHPGQTLLVLATDPHSTVDFQAYSARTGTPLLATGRADAVLYFLLEQPEKQEKT